MTEIEFNPESDLRFRNVMYAPQIDGGIPTLISRLEGFDDPDTMPVCAERIILDSGELSLDSQSLFSITTGISNAVMLEHSGGYIDSLIFAGSVLDSTFEPFTHKLGQKEKSVIEIQVNPGTELEISGWQLERDDLQVGAFYRVEDGELAYKHFGVLLPGQNNGNLLLSWLGKGVIAVSDIEAAADIKNADRLVIVEGMRVAVDGQLHLEYLKDVNY